MASVGEQNAECDPTHPIQPFFGKQCHPSERQQHWYLYKGTYRRCESLIRRDAIDGNSHSDRKLKTVLREKRKRQSKGKSVRKQISR